MFKRTSNNSSNINAIRLHNRRNGCLCEKRPSKLEGVLWAFLKKVSFMLLVTLGFLLDFVISYLMQEKAGTSFSTGGMFGIATTLWLIGTEGMSIIENLGVIGVPIPKFLKPAFSKLKNQAEEAGGKNG